MRLNLSLIVVVGAIPLVLAFQNCTGGFSNHKTSPKDAQVGNKFFGNGGTYDGKLYQSVLLDSNCEDGRNVKDLVQVTSKSTALVYRENCTDITPKEISLSAGSLYEHNPGNMILSESVLDAVDEDSNPTALLCRGNSNRVYAEGEFLVVEDAVLKFSTEDLKNFEGQIKVGVYSGDTLVKSHASSTINLVKTDLGLSSGSERVQYSGVDSKTGHYVSLDLNRQDGSPWKGLMLYSLKAPQNISSIPDNSLDAASGFSTPVNCFEQ